MDDIVIFWFRRDLRLKDNKGLHNALLSGKKVLPIFIFDDEILDKLPQNDARISFIYQTLKNIDIELRKYQSSLLVLKGKPLNIWKQLIAKYRIASVYTNSDYEPYAIARDKAISNWLKNKEIPFHSFKDQVIFEKNDILKKDSTPYTVFTPYKNKWLQHFSVDKDVFEYEVNCDNFYKASNQFPEINTIGFVISTIKVKPFNLSLLANYEVTRDYPAKESTSNLSPYLRFGLVSIRIMVKYAFKTNATFLSELIWREFFMQILYHYPKVITDNFRPKYDAIPWRNNETEFRKWCKGETGYPMVDAGMRQLNTTGYMHNRVRMITAGFLCKHLLIDWRLGEAYFAEKLLDYDLSANNGNWQWAAGTGCDAAPYFRVFNPSEQLKKFDKNLLYVNKWIEDFNELSYPQPIVEHKFARERAIQTYRTSLQ